MVERIVGRGTNDAEVRKVEQNERNGVCVKQRTDENRKDWIHAEKEVEQKRTNELFIVQKR